MLTRFVSCLGLFLLGFSLKAMASIHSAAFFYGQKPPFDKLKFYDAVVVVPNHQISPTQFDPRSNKLYAYVSVGEVRKNAEDALKINQQWVLGSNPAWKTLVMNESNPEWQKYFISNIVKPLWDEGYRGFFIDTLDAYELILTDKTLQEKQRLGLTHIIKTLKRQFPGIHLIINRGFDLLPEVHDDIEAVVAESLFYRWDQKTHHYSKTNTEEHEALLKKLAFVRKYDLPVIIIDYLPKAETAEAEAIARKIRELGFIPWLTDSDLQAILLPSPNEISRKILVLYAEAQSKSPALSNAMKASIPLQFLGTVPDYRYIYDPLPQDSLKNQYAGILVWVNDPKLDRAADLWHFIERQIKEKIPVVIMGVWPFSFDPQIESVLQLKEYEGKTPIKELHYSIRAPSTSYEIDLLPNTNDFFTRRLLKATGQHDVLMEIENNYKEVSDVIAITLWGGYALDPHILTILPDNQTRWLLDPFVFFSQAFHLKALPVPDITTENGKRITFVHVDGDGFVSRVPWTRNEFAGSMMKKAIFERFRIPTTVSIITGELDLPQINTEEKKELIAIAQSIFALPWVEIASHTYSHPFIWSLEKQGVQKKSLHLPIPNYHFNLHQEVNGSVDYINHHLTTPDKKVKLIQWSGDAVVDGKALTLANDLGIKNINGLVYAMSDTNHSLTNLIPYGVNTGDNFQPFAAFQNEINDTDFWRGPFYGFINVIRSFELTDKPKRFKPIDVYYHFYSATEQGALRTLVTVYEWVLKQPIINMFTTDYINRVNDFNHLSIQEDPAGGVHIFTEGYLKEFRSPKSRGFPDFQRSKNIIGFNELNGEYYIHLGPESDALLFLTANPPEEPYLESANGLIIDWTQKNGLRYFRLKGYIKLEFTLANMRDCTLRNNQRILTGQTLKEGRITYRLAKNDSHELTIQCN